MNGTVKEWVAQAEGDFATAGRELQAATAPNYDDAGNLTQNGTAPGQHTFQWDAENRLSSVDNGTTATYTYNAFGQRVEKNVGGTYTEYAYDASAEPVGENNRTSWTAAWVNFQGRQLQRNLP